MTMKAYTYYIIFGRPPITPSSTGGATVLLRDLGYTHRALRDVAPARARKCGIGGADLGFYKGGCLIYLKGHRPLIILTHVTGTKQFLALEEIIGTRRSYDI